MECWEKGVSEQQCRAACGCLNSTERVVAWAAGTQEPAGSVLFSARKSTAHRHKCGVRRWLRGRLISGASQFEQRLGSRCKIAELAILPECFPSLAAVVRALSLEADAVSVGRVDHPMLGGWRRGSRRRRRASCVCRRRMPDASCLPSKPRLPSTRISRPALSPPIYPSNLSACPLTSPAPVVPSSLHLRLVVRAHNIPAVPNKGHCDEHIVQAPFPVSTVHTCRSTTSPAFAVELSPNIMLPLPQSEPSALAANSRVSTSRHRCSKCLGEGRQGHLDRPDRPCARWQRSPPRSTTKPH